MIRIKAILSDFLNPRFAEQVKKKNQQVHHTVNKNLDKSIRRQCTDHLGSTYCASTIGKQKTS